MLPYQYTTTLRRSRICIIPLNNQIRVRYIRPFECNFQIITNTFSHNILRTKPRCIINKLIINFILCWNTERLPTRRLKLHCLNG